MPLEELFAELQDYDLRGFVAYVNHIDAQVAREIPCEGCGGKSLRQRPRQVREWSNH